MPGSPRPVEGVRGSTWECIRSAHSAVRCRYIVGIRCEIPISRFVGTALHTERQASCLVYKATAKPRKGAPPRNLWLRFLRVEKILGSVDMIVRTATRRAPSSLHPWAFDRVLNAGRIRVLSMPCLLRMAQGLQAASLAVYVIDQRASIEFAFLCLDPRIFSARGRARSARSRILLLFRRIASNMPTFGRARCPCLQVDAFFAYQKDVADLRREKIGLWRRKLALLRQAVASGGTKLSVRLALLFGCHASFSFTQKPPSPPPLRPLYANKTPVSRRGRF